MDFINPVQILQFGMVFGSPNRDEGLMGTVQLFDLGRNSLGEFDLTADLALGDEFGSARFTAVVPVPASAFLLLSALGSGFFFRRRVKNA